MEIDPDVKGIVSSGYSTDKVLENYRDYGFVARLSKPYTEKELIAVLTDVIGAQGKST